MKLEALQEWLKRENFGKQFLAEPKLPTRPELAQWYDTWIIFLVCLVFATLAASFPVLAILALDKTQLDGVSKGWLIGIIGFFAAAAVL
jgi:uncharacterized membrane protein YdjX (TVP38/TMEM64 family)